ncbi:acyltransferase family protein [Brevibacillus reuszeri]|uniref:acyltransferase family protein n=1 Tax=Brevibacillus reuszeri TaxID=54915 RepID=UPI003D1B67B9
MSKGIEKNYGGLDGFRMIAIILVIANHTSPLLSYDVFADMTLTRIISRVTVPFFFMCTGYFFFQKIGTDKRKNVDSLMKFLQKLAKLYAFSILLYIPINVYAGYFTNQFSASALVKDILFNGTLYHLWYFPGVMLGVCICYFLYTRFSTKGAFLISLLLYGGGLLGDSYYAFVQMNPYLDSIYQAMFSLFDFTRNGIFFAPVFVMLGGLIAARGKPDQGKCMPYVVGFILFFGLMVTEGLLVHEFHLFRHDSMYLLLIPCMYFLFRLLLSFRSRSKKYLRNLGMYVYVLHPMCIVIIRLVGKATGLTPLIVENSLIHFLLVTVLSFVVSVIAMRAVKKIKNRKAARLHTQGELLKR